MWTWMLLIACGGDPKDTGTEPSPTTTTTTTTTTPTPTPTTPTVDTGTPPQPDADGDGHDAPTFGGDDCDDADATVYPGAPEIWYDGTDQDCRGDNDLDQDHDGYGDAGHGGDDCDDTVPAVNPGALDAPYDGIDADCAGDDDFDQDHDGERAAGQGGPDCDDRDPAMYAGDTDLDGVSPCDGDCDDLAADRAPGLPDACGDGVDQDCSGADVVCPVGDMTGRTYVIDWKDLSIAEPASAAMILSADAIALQVTGQDSVGLAWAGAVSQALPALDCPTASVFGPQDFSANPAFSAGPGTFTFTYALAALPIEDFVFTGNFGADGLTLTDVTMTGLADTRPLDPLFGDTCALVLGLGDTCVACLDGDVACLEFLATAPIATWDAGIDVAGDCGL